MTLDATIKGTRSAHHAGRLLRWRDRRRERERLARRDRVGAQMAELHYIQDLIAAARTLVGSGWVRGAWYVVVDASGRKRTVNSYEARVMTGSPIVGGCLVGAIVHAGGGVAAADEQPVQRALDLTWHTLCGYAEDPVRWCPAPDVRAAHVRDMTRWNDDACRNADEVIALLRSVEQAAVVEIERLRAVGAEAGCPSDAALSRSD
jgi:hypothetical protein